MNATDAFHELLLLRGDQDAVRTWMAQADPDVLQETFQVAVLQQEHDLACWLGEQADISRNLSEAFSWAARWGWTDLIQAWMDRADPATQTGLPFRWACGQGHLATAQALAHVTPIAQKDVGDRALGAAAQNHHDHVVSWLTQAFPAIVDQAVFHLALGNNYAGIDDHLAIFLPWAKQQQLLDQWEAIHLPETAHRLHMHQRHQTMIQRPAETASRPSRTRSRA